MSLHVDFIHDGERHDPVLQVVRTAVVALAFLVAAGCAIYVLFAYLTLASANLELSRAKARTESLGENVRTAVALEEEVKLLRLRHAELTAVSNGAFRASRQLEALAGTIPPDVQLTSFRINSELVPEDEKNLRYGRRFRGDCSGRTAADGAEEVVVSMIGKMRSVGDARLGTVTPGGLDIDPANPSSLVFDVRFDFGFHECGSLKSGPVKKGGTSR